MLAAVAEAAAEAISALTAQGGIEDQGGIRFAMQPEADSQVALALTVAPEPAEGDQVVKADTGANVFLEQQAAAYLSDKVLDVQPDTEGQLSFAVLEKA